MKSRRLKAGTPGKSSSAESELRSATLSVTVLIAFLVFVLTLTTLLLLGLTRLTLLALSVLSRLPALLGLTALLALSVLVTLVLPLLFHIVCHKSISPKKSTKPPRFLEFNRNLLS
jgi:hypothetical protein